MDPIRIRIHNTDLNLMIIMVLEMNKFIPSGRMDPSTYNQLLDPIEARYRLARAVLAEIPRQVYSYIGGPGQFWQRYQNRHIATGWPEQFW